MTGEGAFANAVQIPLQPFTLVGATTRTGLLTAPLLSRFGHVVRLDFYPAEDLARIVQRSAALSAWPSSRDAARRDRAPRRAARRASPIGCSAASATSRRCSERRASTAREVTFACDRLEIDAAGLDEMDRRFLAVIIDHYDGGPVGIETLAAALAEPRDTLEDVYEPYLLQQGYIGRTPRGRVANAEGLRGAGKDCTAEADRRRPGRPLRLNRFTRPSAPGRR